MDDLIILCDKIEACRLRSKCQSNEIVCAKKWVKEYIGDDNNKLLKLKAEVKIHKPGDDTGNMAILLSTCSLILAIIYNVDRGLYMLYAFLLVSMILLLSIIQSHYSKKRMMRKKWIAYVGTVLDNMEI